jgi:hypothetical protein
MKLSKVSFSSFCRVFVALHRQAASLRNDSGTKRNASEPEHAASSIAVIASIRGLKVLSLIETQTERDFACADSLRTKQEAP